MEASHRTKGLLRLTMACNERCPFCNVPVEDYARPTPPEAETLAELDAFVASGERTLTISGGEPTLMRARLVRIVREARARGVPNVELQTNAVLLTPDYARELAKAGVTSAFVSLLSHEAEHHDALAGLDGAFPRCLAGIDACLDAGIAVTLNPVVARATQSLLPEYVRFVAARLPRVRSISLSAVQPHGRARQNVDLLPDYDLLGPAVEQARAEADRFGIGLVNPYCGLPVCVGWTDGLERSVEAVEARAGGWRTTPGIENQGDKAHGPACARCVYRPLCGGAWRAYWTERGGRGLVPPIELVEPWSGVGAAQEVVRALAGKPPPSLSPPTTPTRWLWTDHAAPALVPLPFTHLALDLPVERLDVDSVRALRSFVGRRVHVGLRLGNTPVDLRPVVRALVDHGAHAVTLLGSPAWARLVDPLQAGFPGVRVGWSEGAERLSPPPRT
jgi:MoaA/NifB/PqqE/SkfB family radical SAM enzyme